MQWLKNLQIYENKRVGIDIWQLYVGQIATVTFHWKEEERGRFEEGEDILQKRQIAEETT